MDNDRSVSPLERIEPPALSPPSPPAVKLNIRPRYLSGRKRTVAGTFDPLTFTGAQRPSSPTQSHSMKAGRRSPHRSQLGPICTATRRIRTPASRKSSSARGLRWKLTGDHERPRALTPIDQCLSCPLGLRWRPKGQRIVISGHHLEDGEESVSNEVRRQNLQSLQKNGHPGEIAASASEDQAGCTESELTEALCSDVLKIKPTPPWPRPQRNKTYKRRRRPDMMKATEASAKKKKRLLTTQPTYTESSELDAPSNPSCAGLREEEAGGQQDGISAKPRLALMGTSLPRLPTPESTAPRPRRRYIPTRTPIWTRRRLAPYLTLAILTRLPLIGPRQMGPFSGRPAEASSRCRCGRSMRR